MVKKMCFCCISFAFIGDRPRRGGPTHPKAGGDEGEAEEEREHAGHEHVQQGGGAVQRPHEAEEDRGGRQGQDQRDHQGAGHQEEGGASQGLGSGKPRTISV